ncbi:M56 family metallopeptidase [Mucilaginibacter pedocola]|uniref:Peptidase M56 domain-containing protein n=1 Tax=Mucilaginibacter pedocola TaxID=1792845 RepID=A0A1S9PKW6_9SPHI|nr:M56 family metallopeptidase [Mucilaginibacter pedocola]OOQ61591.1 hypothetical protein BC343_00500 [Mucilaginibacter pedocola]
MDKLAAAIPDNVVIALCNTLLHSLWLGLLLAVAAGLIVVSTRRSRAQFRYNLLLIALAVFTSAVLFVFVSEFSAAAEEPASIAAAKMGAYKAVPEVYVVVADTNYYTEATAFLNAHAGLVVMVWFLIVMARTLQMLTGLQSLYFLRRRHVVSVGEQLETRVAELAKQLGIKRLVRIAESGIAKVPMVVGHLKPLILIPAGLISALPPASIEAILVHELAHIRRRDYLVNLVIGILEIVLFFNPAVLWVATLIREERENCCDDIAIAVTGNKISYIKALVSCREYQPGAPAYAMAFGGKKDHLLGRVKRMLHNSNPSLNTIERAILGAGLLLAVVCTTAFSTTGKFGKPKGKAVKPKTTTVTVSQHTESTKTEVTVKTTKNINQRKAVQVVKSDSIELEQQRNIRIYKPAEVGEHTNITLSAGGIKTRLVKADGVLYQLNSRQNRIVSLQMNGITVAPSQYKPYLFLMDHATQPQANALSPINAKLDSLSHLKAKAQPIAPIEKKTAAIAAKPESFYPESSYPQTYKPYTKMYDAYHEDSARDRLAADLVASGIIGAPGELKSFKLSTTEFIVNGKKVPDDIYQKFKKAYIPAPEKGKQGEWSWMYNYDVSKVENHLNELLADSTEKTPVA